MNDNNNNAEQEKKSDEIEQQEPKDIVSVVGIGASAGGLEALEQFFANIPNQTNRAFVVIQHLDPKHKSVMDSILQKYTDMETSQVKDGTRIEPNHIYIGPSDKDVIVQDSMLLLVKPRKTKGVHLPIDLFFRSLAQNFEEDAIGIILSGTGTDGTLGIKAIKSIGGITIAQQEEQAKYPGMPRSAIESGFVDLVLPVEAMGENIEKYAKRPYLEKKRKREIEDHLLDINLKKIFHVTKKETGNDFSGYKRSTIIRRIEKRMAIQQIDSIDDYVEYLRDNPSEVKALFKDFLIRVTNFFRDPDAFESLKNNAIIPRLEEKSQDSSFRVWVPGCSTGEEVYSLAIVIAEAMEELNKSFTVQIFASDLDEEAVEFARAAVYPQNISADISPKRLNRYFVLQSKDRYSVKKEIREMIIFAIQNLLQDPPFSKLDMISCRNLLIYMTSDTQNKLIPLFHYSLSHNGILFLGTSESIGRFTDIFDSIDAKHRIFRGKSSGAETGYDVFFTGKGRDEWIEERAQRYTNFDIGKLAEKVVLDKHMSSTVLVDKDYEILYFIGDTNKYLANPKGERNFNVLKMARWGLRNKIKKGLEEAKRTQKPMNYKNIQLRHDDDICLLDLRIQPISRPNDTELLLLVVFYEKPYLKEILDSQFTESQETEFEVRRLKDELDSTKADLQVTIEELETSNEELQSVNEELQSTNEELVTSQEELRATNEELSTVNAELQEKVNKLRHARDDADNLLVSTNVATIFLDNDLHIKRFTPQMKKFYNLRPSDIGRPISDITANIAYDNLEKDAKYVLDNLERKEIGFSCESGDRYSIRISLYRTSENIIRGVVVSFVDITDVKDAQLYAESIVDTVRHPLVVLDDDLKITSVNQAFLDTFEVSDGETKGKLIYNLDNGQWNISKLRELLENIIPENNSFEDYLIEHDFPKIGYRKMLLNAREVKQNGRRQELILLAIEDVTNR
jgi:two-component system CheB/CheR fusion protein